MNLILRRIAALPFYLAGVVLIVFAAGSALIGIRSLVELDTLAVSVLAIQTVVSYYAAIGTWKLAKIIYGEPTNPLAPMPDWMTNLRYTGPAEETKS